MEFIAEHINQYSETHSSPETELLANLNRDTYANVLVPRMLSGHLQGRILSMLSHLKQPQHILEVGTYTGYSALCLAEGLQVGGSLHTIDKNEELETRIKKYFDQSVHKDQLHVHFGNALEIIPTLTMEFDLVFIDADKENYSNYYRMLIDRLPSGALIIADNVLWSGKVVDLVQLSKDAETIALHAFNQMIQADDRVENVLLPVRDGLMVIRKR